MGVCLCMQTHCLFISKGYHLCLFGSKGWSTKRSRCPFGRHSLIYTTHSRHICSGANFTAVLSTLLWPAGNLLAQSIAHTFGGLEIDDLIEEINIYDFVARSYSAFAQLLMDTEKMMAWNEFCSSSEDVQNDFLARNPSRLVKSKKKNRNRNISLDDEEELWQLSRLWVLYWLIIHCIHSFCNKYLINLVFPSQSISCLVTHCR